MNDSAAESRAVLPLLTVQARRLLRDRVLAEQDQELRQLVQQDFVLDGRVADEALRERAEAMVRVHGALRVAFPNGIQSTAQVVGEARAADVLLLVAPEELDEAAAAVAEQLRDLSSAPLVHIIAARDGRTTRLRVVAEHLVADGWSVHLLVRDLATGRARAPLSYEEYVRARVASLAGALGDALLDEYGHVVDGHAPTPNVPRALGVHRAASGAASDVVGFGGRRSAVDAVREAAARHRTSPFALLLACWCSFLESATGRTDLCVVVPVANRATSAEARLVGWLANSALARVVNRSGGFDGWCAGAHAAVSRAVRLAPLPWALMAARYRVALYERPDDRDPTRPPMVRFSASSPSAGPLNRVDGVAVRPNPRPHGITNGISLNVHEDVDRYRAVVESQDTDDDGARLILRGFCEHLAHVLRDGRRAPVGAREESRIGR